jgi:hypothetical protein
MGSAWSVRGLRTESILAGVVVCGLFLAPSRGSAAPVLAEPTDQRRQTALQEKLRDALREEVKARREAMVQFWDPLVVEAAWLLLQTELTLADKPGDRVALYESHVKFLAEMEKEKRRLFAKIHAPFEGKVKTPPCPGLTAERLRAQIALLREQAGRRPSAEQAAEIRKRLVERRDELRAQRKEQTAWSDYLRSRATADRQSALDGCSEELRRDLLDAELELTDDPDERLALVRAYFAEVKTEFGKLKKADDKFDPYFPPPDTFRAGPYGWYEAHRDTAEVLLLRAEARGRKLTADEQGRLTELLKKRADSLQLSIPELREATKIGLTHCAASMLSVYALRLRWALEDDPANSPAAWRAYQLDVEDVGGMLNGLAKSDAAVKAMAEAARLRAEIGVLKSAETKAPR